MLLRERLPEWALMVAIGVLLASCGGSTPTPGPAVTTASSPTPRATSSTAATPNATPPQEPGPSVPAALRPPLLVPAAVAARQELPWCGHEVVDRQPTGDHLDAAVRECFLASYGIGEPAEFVSDGVTVEGGRWRTILRSLGDGDVEVYYDSTADPLSARNWTRARCEGLQSVGADPAGVPNFVADGCDEAEAVADDSSTDPMADELLLIASLITFAQSPGAESFGPIPFADEVALGLGDQLIARHPRQALAEPTAWVLDGERFRGRAGSLSALDILGRWERNAGDMPVRELSVTVGPHPHCASPPMAQPDELAAVRRVSVQPIGPDTCLLWWSVDLFLTDNVRIAAVTLDLFEP